MSGLHRGVTTRFGQGDAIDSSIGRREQNISSYSRTSDEVSTLDDKLGQRDLETIFTPLERVSTSVRAHVRTRGDMKVGETRFLSQKEAPKK